MSYWINLKSKHFLEKILVISLKYTIKKIRDYYNIYVK